MTILLDMNLSPRWVAFLSDHGHHAVHWSSVGAAAAPDIEIMNYARQQWRKPGPSRMDLLFSDKPCCAASCARSQLDNRDNLRDRKTACAHDVSVCGRYRRPGRWPGLCVQVGPGHCSRAGRPGTNLR
ncbi:MAG: DUF5615 family PIN-like protein [Candidatus Eremiobacteraeota bacterium]|nr:DUF5615 family PIN-like protein [Candidatus Eremiobacteraeota bacterium]MCW5870203.1 DUF5615 family PIN-like protein [Candidatus Eremiobacteraeota bacterium]